MRNPPSPLTILQQSHGSGTITPLVIARDSLAHANSSPSHNTYIHLDGAALLAQAEALEACSEPRPPLYGVPISLKDCFDLAGTRTSCGTRFYEERHPPAAHNSSVAQRLLDAGCLIPGKTHLHALAYGITGQNSDYGDCLQPRDSTLLTGGSSSGAAASVQEGSAFAAIGTDTGGSIRVPAAICGLAGFRASHALTGRWPAMWQGAAHLAPSFDTLGLLCRDPRDLAPLAQTLFRIPSAAAPATPTIGCVAESFLHDAVPEVLTAYRAWKSTLASRGATLLDFTPNWAESLEIFAGIQAHEASAIHAGYFDHFDPPIAQRLHWGASLNPAEVAALRRRHATFNTRLLDLFGHFDLLLLPCAPVNRLPANSDQTTARQQILRYTTPFSLAGLPTAALPGESFGTGIQLAAAPGHDATLLAFTARLGNQ